MDLTHGPDPDNKDFCFSFVNEVLVTGLRENSVKYLAIKHSGNIFHFFGLPRLVFLKLYGVQQPTGDVYYFAFFLFLGSRIEQLLPVLNSYLLKLLYLRIALVFCNAYWMCRNFCYYIFL